MNKLLKKMQNQKVQKCIIVAIFILYFVFGVFLVDDYGISTDEPHERRTMYINLNYIKTKLGRGSEEIQDLNTYEERYYGMALQMPLAILEKFVDNENGVYLVRHFYTFCLCFVGYIFFFFLCKKLFQSNYLSLIGTLMLMLYPRFFAEQFYNIKDMVFMSMFIISMWVTERLISSNFSVKYIVLFSVITAITTNVRIVGIIFVMILLGYLWMAKILQAITGKEIHTNLTYKRTVGISLSIVWSYIIVFGASIPAVWKDPVHEIVNVFTTFSDYEWGGNVVFLGNIIRGSEVPWYYIPVWLMISVPFWYILSVIINVVLCGKKMMFYIKNRMLLDKIIEYKYMLWVVLLFGAPWLGMVILGSTLYNAWRHCYFMLPPLVIFSLYGLKFLCVSIRKSMIYVLNIVIIFCLLLQGGWIAKNHPHEMVYFNLIGKNYAANFDRDYWHLSEYQAWKYIMEHDSSEKISIDSAGTKFFRMRTNEEELSRIEFSDNPVYFIYTYRGQVGNEYHMEDYEEYYSFIVDGFKVATIYKKK